LEAAFDQEAGVFVAVVSAAGVGAFVAVVLGVEAFTVAVEAAAVTAAVGIGDLRSADPGLWGILKPDECRIKNHNIRFGYSSKGQMSSAAGKL
jgi:hypothetical protein